MSRDKRRAHGMLSPEDRKLWETVTRSVTPLGDRKAKTAAAEANAPKKKADPKPPAKKSASKAVPAEPYSPHISSPVRPALTEPSGGFDRRTRQRIAKGSIAIDARIDLHGMTQREAHTRLKSFIAHCHHRGDKHVLVITGKGGRPGGGYDFNERGVLRRVVPQWLSLPEFRVHVVGFDEAHIAHGGGGAFYVRLRGRAKKHPR